jgi:hypothetical protein
MTVRVALALATLGLGCGTPPTEMRLELRSYLERSRAWAPVEAETARTIERILNTQFVNEAEVRRQIADGRPRALAHVEQLRSFRARSEELQQVHAHYLVAWEALLSGYDAIETGFETGEYTNLARGREALTQWREAIVDVARELRALMDHFGVEPGPTLPS